MTLIDHAPVPATLRRRTDLGGTWELQLLDAGAGAPEGARALTLEGHVPGQVHTDLMRAGLLEDPDVAMRERDQMWIGRSRWSYSRSFEWQAAAGAVELVADGLDTVATVLLNGHRIAQTRDQHISYRWHVRPHLVEGTNRIEVVFESAWDAAAERERSFGPLPTPYDEPYPYIRKSACNFGWDWGPHYVTAGIWQPIAIEAWSGRIEHVRPLVTLSEDHRSAGVAVTVRHDRIDELEAATLVAVLRAPDGEVVASASADTGPDGADTVVPLQVADPQLWWPAGYGEQPLYELTVELRTRDGVTLDEWQRAIGIRSVQTVATPDAAGEQWAILVNGRRIRIRGYNWIPEDPFIAEVTEDRLAQRLDQAVDGNANLLRIWGGGYFATEEFLDGCDRRGILVWHDFLFACAGYDETGGMSELIRVEAEQAVARLSSHASVAIWCGGNECVWGHEEWGWEDTLGEHRTWGAGFYTELLPSIVADLDPTRPYLPNSPWSTLPGAKANDQASGPAHLWDIWNNRDFAEYRSSDPAFVSEMGWCAPPAATTLRKVITEGSLLPDNPQVAHHMRASEGMHKLARGLQPYFTTPATEEDWLYQTQLVQARAERTGTEWLRSRDRCAGVVIWQLNDCWPVLSWSAVDADGIEKPMWFGLRRAFAPRLLTVQPVKPGGTQDPSGTAGLELVAVNDGAERWSPSVRVRRLGFDGTELASAVVDLDAAVDENARLVLDDAISKPEDPAAEFLVADVDGARAVWTYRPDRAAAMPRARWVASVAEGDRGVEVTVHAETVLFDLCLFTDRLADLAGLPGDALVADDQLITLLPGESHTFAVRARAGERVPSIDPAALAVGGAILRAANDTAPERRG
ncbi:beta-mannosidase [Agromyces terreus]|uniref:beta-mannosidase n=1 Tax=Agromyces terreus TaxID=424795 RepID=A0A9X2KAF5_9MICO|nr:glycoside hydrolase family 2 protein [Agromyces terreus]MCP2370313.1 beta-mannosidase [Agromyces terreus]